MDMLSRKDLNSAELETVKVSKSTTTVVTANGEVQTKEEATVYVKELDFFVTVMLFEDTPAVLSHGKLCEDHGYSYHWTSGQKPQLIKNGRRITCNTANYVPIVVPGLSTDSSSSAAPTSPTSLSHKAHQREVRVRVAAKEYGEIRCVICQNDWKSSLRILWMTVSQNTETHRRVPLVNYLLLENKDYKFSLQKTCRYSRAKNGKFW